MPYYNNNQSIGSMSSFEKSVKGGTKVKLAPPKSKYVEPILLATRSGESAVAEVFRTLTHRLHDSTWTVAFKALIIVHLMIKEGAPDVTLSYLSQQSRSILAVNQITDAQTQGQNIKRYSEYLRTRAQAFSHAKCDYVRSGDARLKRLSVDKGLLRETEIVQEQIKALLKCDLLDSDPENEISLTAHRLMTRDLMDLYNAQNEAVMNVLSHYFEMSRPDAERSIRIYKKFCSQTAEVVQYLSVARQYSYATRLDIPKIKHAPTGLAKSLQDYLDDPNFEINRRQYLAEQEAKRTGRPVQKSPPPKADSARPFAAPASSKAVEAGPVAAAPVQQPKGPAPDLIDFFESIEQNQQTLAQSVPQFQQQVTGFPQQQQQQQQQTYGYQQDPQSSNNFAANGTNPFAQFAQPQQQQQQQQPQQIQTQFTGAAFGAYGQQPQQQPQPQQQQFFTTGNAFNQEPQAYTSPVQSPPPAQFQAPQQTGTNPFRQASMPTGSFTHAAAPQQTAMPTRQNTNPFARNTEPAPAVSSSPFAPQQQQQQQPPMPPIPQGQTYQPMMQPQATGTNPFARNVMPSAPQQVSNPMLSPLQVQQTGSTNPFRQSAFVNQQTGQGWQYAPQGTMGGLEGLETIPVFPRPTGTGT